MCCQKTAKYLNAQAFKSDISNLNYNRATSFILPCNDTFITFRTLNTSPKNDNFIKKNRRLSTHILHFLNRISQLFDLSWPTVSQRTSEGYTV